MRRLWALLVLPVLLLTACGSDEPAASAEEEGPPPVTDLAEVEVTGEPGEKPTITVDGEYSVTESDRRVLTEGEGPVVEEGQTLKIDYLGVNGRDGAEFDTSFGEGRATFTLARGQIIDGFLDGLVGTTVGSRVLVGVAPDDGYGPQGGVEGAGIEADDSLLFVIDVHGVVPQRATGTAVEQMPNLPQVALDENGKPTITIPDREAPTELLVQPLITGTGPPVAAGQTVSVHYTGVKWADGSQFDSSWDRGAAAQFPIGTGNVISAWDIALVGQPVGSQVLIVAPPEHGYGAEGRPDSGISGTDTLVFVVDILDAS